MDIDALARSLGVEPNSLPQTQPLPSPQQAAPPPAAVAPPPPGTVRLDIEVPEGANAGDRLTYSTAAGQFSLVLPLGAAPGKKMMVTMPVPANFASNQPLTISELRINGNLPAPSEAALQLEAERKADSIAKELIEEEDAEKARAAGRLAASKAKAKAKKGKRGPAAPLPTEPPTEPQAAGSSAAHHAAGAAATPPATAEPPIAAPASEAPGGILDLKVAFQTFAGEIRQLLFQRTHYYDAGLKGSTALIYYDLPRACFVLQKNEGQYPLREDRLLTFLADYFRKNVSPADGEDGPTQLLRMRLKPFSTASCATAELLGIQTAKSGPPTEPPGGKGKVKGKGKVSAISAEAKGDSSAVSAEPSAEPSADDCERARRLRAELAVVQARISGSTSERMKDAESLEQLELWAAEDAKELGVNEEDAAKRKAEAEATEVAATLAIYRERPWLTKPADLDRRAATKEDVTDMLTAMVAVKAEFTK
eukprot:scaffold43685_cov42-Phaeocystis_antarctica.AAC.1